MQNINKPIALDPATAIATIAQATAQILNSMPSQSPSKGYDFAYAMPDSDINPDPDSDTIETFPIDSLNHYIYSSILSNQLYTYIALLNDYSLAMPDTLDPETLLDILPDAKTLCIKHNGSTHYILFYYS